MLASRPAAASQEPGVVNALTTRMAGMRQGMAIAAALVGLMYFAQALFAPGQQRTIPVALSELLLGAVFVVWSIEEHVRGNTLFTAVFGALGLLVFGYSAYCLLQ